MSIKKNNHIVSISFLNNGKRKTLKARPDGTFRLPVVYYHNGREKTTFKNLTAKEVIEHDYVKTNDPVVTLSTGEKIRVFTNGDSSYMPAMSEGILVRHDREKKTDKLRNKMKKKVICPDPPKDSQYDDIFGFPDLSDYGDGYD